MKRLFTVGFFHVLFITICVRGAGFLQQIGLARILTPEELGMVVYIMRILTTVCVFADLGISTSLLKYSAEDVDTERKSLIYCTALTSVFYISLFFTIIFVSMVFLTDGFGVGSEMIVPLALASLYIPFATLNRLPSLYLQAQKKIKLASKISGGLHLLMLAMILLAAYRFRLNGYLFALVGGQLVAVIVLLGFTWSAFRYAKVTFSMFKTLADYGFFSMLANFSGVINATMGVLMLRWLGYSFHEIALYGVASVVVNGLRLIPKSLLQTAFPYLVSSVNDSQMLKSKTREILLKQSVVVVVVAIAAAVAGYWMLPLMFGEVYQASWPTMVILLISMVFWAIGAGYGQLQMALDQVRLNFAISFAQLIVNFLLSMLLIPVYGAPGAAAALCFSFALHMVLLCVSGERSLRLHARKMSLKVS
ncbi:MAG: oligosaccharide flippase family protein [Desulfuromonadales bacterium]|nr:oligosaccharide flippase family protein [Desulfuromonadales bacterium]